MVLKWERVKNLSTIHNPLLRIIDRADQFVYYEQQKKYYNNHSKKYNTEKVLEFRRDVFETIFEKHVQALLWHYTVIQVQQDWYVSTKKEPRRREKCWKKVQKKEEFKFFVVPTSAIYPFLFSVPSRPAPELFGREGHHQRICRKALRVQHCIRTFCVCSSPGGTIKVRLGKINADLYLLHHSFKCFCLGYIINNFL